MAGIEYVVECAENLLKMKPAEVLKAVIGRKIPSTHADDSQIEVINSFLGSSIPRPISSFVLQERGQKVDYTEILNNNLLYIASHLSEKGIGSIPASDLNSLSLEELAKKYDLSPEVKTQIHKYADGKSTPAFEVGEAILYRKKPHKAPVLGQMELL